jgi:hypothetical protein
MNRKQPFLIRSNAPAVDLDDLAHAAPSELQRVYRQIFGCIVPAGSSELARRKIAWYVQAEREGGLPESARQHALAIARSSEIGVRTRTNRDRRNRGLPLQHAVTAGINSDHDSRLPMPGSVIVKEYKGRTILVKVLDSEFEYGGERFASLSAIAKKITGTKWNGLLFFGLAKARFSGR